jgi:transcriptional regulator with XRE-family HTH domain
VARRRTSPANRLRERLATNLRRERARRDLTQERAAEVVGLTLQHYQRIEWCRVNVPLDTLARIAASFALDPAALLADR